MNSSIFIPRIHSRRTIEEVTAAFKKNDFGIVSRVDFTPINKRPGFGEDVDSVVKSAFVHFSELFESGQSIYWVASQGEAYKFYPFRNSREYWLILPARNPIHDTMMNNAQIVENCRLLENRVKEQDAKIKELEEKLEGVHNVVYQLLGGLFNKRTQTRILHTHLSYLLPNERLYKNLNQSNEEESKWCIWPTTRQGDANEERIARLEEILLPRHDLHHSYLFDLSDEDEEQDTELFERKRADSVSSHSSIPELISCVSSCSSSIYEDV